MTRNGMARTLREAVAALQPIVDRLRELERRDSAIGLQLASIPARVPRGAEPETALNGLIAKNDSAVADAVGREDADPRQLLDLLQNLARLAGAELDTSKMPVGVKVWTSDEHRFDIVEPGRLVGGARLGEVWDLAERVSLTDDGSLKTLKARGRR